MSQATIEQTVQIPGSSIVTQLESAVSQAEQLRDQQVEQEYSIATNWASMSKKRRSKSTGCNPAWRRANALQNSRPKNDRFPRSPSIGSKRCRTKCIPCLEGQDRLSVATRRILV